MKLRKFSELFTGEKFSYNGFYFVKTSYYQAVAYDRNYHSNQDEPLDGHGFINIGDLCPIRGEIVVNSL